jgi:hypothetical protein
MRNTNLTSKHLTRRTTIEFFDERRVDPPDRVELECTVSTVLDQLPTLNILYLQNFIITGQNHF